MFLNTDNGRDNLNTNCIICLQLADQALVTTCCVDLICKKCFQRLTKSQCPKCRHQVLQVQQELISPQIQFFVKSITGDTVVIKLRQLDTLDMLFQRVYEKTDVPIKQMRLTCQGRNLIPSNQSLRSAKITADCTIYQLSRLKGGKE